MATLPSNQLLIKKNVQEGSGPLGHTPKYSPVTLASPPYPWYSTSVPLELDLIFCIFFTPDEKSGFTHHFTIVSAADLSPPPPHTRFGFVADHCIIRMKGGQMLNDGSNFEKSSVLKTMMDRYSGRE